MAQPTPGPVSRGAVARMTAGEIARDRETHLGAQASRELRAALARLREVTYPWMT